MIYCVIPAPLADELYDRLVGYYESDPNVTVIIDRRRAERREESIPVAVKDEQREVRDRRRPRVPGEFPAMIPALGDA